MQYLELRVQDGQYCVTQNGRHQGIFVDCMANTCLLLRFFSLWVGSIFARLGPKIPEAWELITAPINHTLDKWFESEPLKASLATDAVIGAMVGPSSPGSGSVF